eukprot:scaffold59125_cov17-Tisochrysis_lutea.AAC.1
MDVQVISVSLIKRQTADVPGPWIMNTPHDHNKVMKVPATRKQSTNSIHRPLLLACSTMQDGQTDATDTCSELADFPIPLCVVTVLCQAFCVSALQHMLTSRVANFHMTNPANKCLPTTIPQSAQTHLCQESNVDGDLQVCSHHGQGLARVVLQARRVMQTDRGVQPDGVASVSEEVLSGCVYPHLRQKKHASKFHRMRRGCMHGCAETQALHDQQRMISSNRQPTMSSTCSAAAADPR